MTKKEAIEKVVTTAEKELGYHEKKSKKDLDSKTANAGSANYTKYAEWFDTKAEDFYNTKKNPCSWCDIFVDWVFCACFTEAKAREMLYQPKMSLGAGCKYSAGYYRAKKAFYTAPEVGDQIFFGKLGAETHTGLVVKVTDSMVYTIEGNSANEVRKKSYKKSNSKISGYGRPDWAVVTGAESPSNASQGKNDNSSAPAAATPTAGNTAPKTDTNKPTPPAKFFSKAYKKTLVVTAVHGLNMREGAGTDKDKIIVIPKGKKVTCDGSYSKVGDEPWLLVTYTTKEGQKYKGFCCSKYLK